MSMQLAQVNRALGKPVGTPWPETFTPKQIAHFAVWRGDEPDPHWSARAAPLIDLLTLACQCGELTCTTITERVPDPNWPVRPRIIAKRYNPYGPPIQRDRPPPRPTVEVTRYSIAAAPLAAWLDAQRVRPGELLQAWFEAQGVGVAAVEAAHPAPAAQLEAVLMPSPATAMKKTGMVKAFKNRWPTIESDMSDAARNGLSVARAGERGWDECKALEWARARGKLHMESIAPTPEPADPMAAHFGRLSKLPSHRHGG